MKRISLDRSSASSEFGRAAFDQTLAYLTQTLGAPRKAKGFERLSEFFIWEDVHNGAGLQLIAEGEDTQAGTEGSPYSLFLNFKLPGAKTSSPIFALAALGKKAALPPEFQKALKTRDLANLGWTYTSDAAFPKKAVEFAKNLITIIKATPASR